MPFFLNLKALYSACGLPPIDVYPEEITELFLTKTQPTAGFSFVFPKLIFAFSKARFKNILCKLGLLFF